MKISSLQPNKSFRTEHPCYSCANPQGHILFQIMFPGEANRIIPKSPGFLSACNTSNCGHREMLSTFFWDWFMCTFTYCFNLSFSPDYFFLIYLKNIMISLPEKISGKLISCSLVLEETTNDITWRCVRTLEREACLSGQQWPFLTIALYSISSAMFLSWATNKGAPSEIRALEIPLWELKRIPRRGRAFNLVPTRDGGSLHNNL